MNLTEKMFDIKRGSENLTDPSILIKPIMNIYTQPDNSDVHCVMCSPAEFLLSGNLLF